MTQRTALISGAARGYGAALAEHLAQQGHRVAVHYRQSRAEAEALVKRLQQHGAEAFCYAADLASEADAVALVDAVVQRWGALDVVVHSAGTFAPVHPYEMSAEQWREGLDSTISAGFFLTRAALPALRKSGAGRIILLGDSLADRVLFCDSAMSYYVGKHGLWMLTQTLAALEAKHGITVNMISPGMMQNSVGLPAPETMPTGRHVQFEDLHRAVDFLIEPSNGQVSGANLMISGGWNLAPQWNCHAEKA